MNVNKIYIYESSSKGGCFEYSKCLLNAYPDSFLILPVNANYAADNVSKILISDEPAFNIKVYRKVHFLLRQFLNPLILFFFMLNKKKSLIILNDFEQISAPLWAPLYALFLRKHIRAVFLHDPDRDNYPPSPSVSGFCMKSMMKSMNLGLYHEFLPEKPYYSNISTKFIKVPHGLYGRVKSDEKLVDSIKERKEEKKLMAIIGNIREEKNYDLAIRALKSLPDWKLLIAGAPANSLVSTKQYKDLAAELGVEGQIIWFEKFLSDEELSSVIEASDLVLLYYNKNFTSQSGILNLIAPFKKRVLISDTPSSLSDIARRFNLGILVPADDLGSFIKGVIEATNFQNSGWENYNSYASWDKQVELVLNEIK